MNGNRLTQPGLTRGFSRGGPHDGAGHRLAQRLLGTAPCFNDSVSRFSSRKRFHHPPQAKLLSNTGRTGSLCRIPRRIWMEALYEWSLPACIPDDRRARPVPSPHLWSRVHPAGPLTLTCANYVRFLPIAAGDVRPGVLALTWVRGDHNEMLRPRLPIPASMAAKRRWPSTSSVSIVVTNHSWRFRSSLCGIPRRAISTRCEAPRLSHTPSAADASASTTGPLAARCGTAPVALSGQRYEEDRVDRRRRRWARSRPLTRAASDECPDRACWNLTERAAAGQGDRRPVCAAPAACAAPGRWPDHPSFLGSRRWSRSPLPTPVLSAAARDRRAPDVIGARSLNGRRLVDAFNESESVFEALQRQYRCNAPWLIEEVKASARLMGPTYPRTASSRTAARSIPSVRRPPTMDSRRDG